MLQQTKQQQEVDKPDHVESKQQFDTLIDVRPEPSPEPIREVMVKRV